MLFLKALEKILIQETYVGTAEYFDKCNSAVCCLFSLKPIRKEILPSAASR